VLGSVDGLKRFVGIAEKPVSRPELLPGHVSEMLEKPGEQIFDVIRWFGTRKKIFNVHFRNIRGGFLNFQETFIDDGDVDMLKAMRVYKEVGYDGMMMPDHVPRVKATRTRRRGSRSRSATSRRSSRRWTPNPACSRVSVVSGFSRTVISTTGAMRTDGISRACPDGWRTKGKARQPPSSSRSFSREPVYVWHRTQSLRTRSAFVQPERMCPTAMTRSVFAGFRKLTLNSTVSTSRSSRHHRQRRINRRRHRETRQQATVQQAVLLRESFIRIRTR
jgi:hypothetical protein